MGLAQDGPTQYILYIGYKLTNDPALVADARNLESRRIASRALCNKGCEEGNPSATCEGQCEIAFRECILGIEKTEFRLAICPKDNCDTVRDVGSLSSRQATSPDLNVEFNQTNPNRYATTGLYFVASRGCELRRVENDEAVHFSGDGKICDLVDIGRKGWLREAAGDGDIPTVTSLLNSGVPINPGPFGGFAPLAAAATKGQFEMARFLLRRGADVELGDGLMSPLALAVQQSNLDIATLLLQFGADVNSRGADWCRRPLDILATRKSSRRTRALFALLVDHGADVNDKDGHWERPLHCAAKRGSTELGELLISRGADINAPDPEESERSALGIAVRNGDLDFVEMLLRHHARVNIAGGSSSLRLAIDLAETHPEGKYQDIVKVLRAHGAK